MPSHRIAEFDIWREKYNGAVVSVYIAGTTTLADLFTDEALTIAAANPQTLDSLTEDNRHYGKWNGGPFYTASSYYLDIDSSDQTGIVRLPLTTLAEADASEATARAESGSVDVPLEDLLDRRVYVRDHGAFLPTSDSNASTSTNNATLVSAIGVASAQGGGDVILPAGIFQFTTLTLSGGVRLVGQGRTATVLKSTVADEVVTIGGDGAGLANLTLDGATLLTGSVGIYSKANDEVHFSEILVKRFATGIYFKGGRRADWRDFYIDNCTTGAKLHGDTDAGGGSDGDEFRHNRWVGGKVSTCTTIGIDLSFEDAKCYHNQLVDIGIENNTGIGINFNGCRFTELRGVWYSGNTTNWAVGDDDDTDNETINTIVGLHMKGGSIVGGAATFTETCQDVLLEGMEISDVDFTLTLPLNPILVKDCTEDALVTLSGNGDAWMRLREIHGNNPGSSGTTEDATATKAWQIHLESGQVGLIEAVIVGNQQNGIGKGVYHISRVVERAGATLNYDAQTANFTVGDVLTGAVSGATARIVADSDSGSTGTLTIRDIVGTFQDDEAITDGAGGAAVANGVITQPDATLKGSTVTITTAYEVDAAWAADFAVNAGNVEIQVTGEASKTIEWVVHAKVTLN